MTPKTLAYQLIDKICNFEHFQRFNSNFIYRTLKLAFEGEREDADFLISIASKMSQRHYNSQSIGSREALKLIDEQKKLVIFNCLKNRYKKIYI